MSYGKYLDKLPQPGFRLNSFLVDVHLENEEKDNEIDIETVSKQPTPSNLPIQSTVKTLQKRKLLIKDLNTPHNKIEKIENNQTLIKSNQASVDNSVTFRSFSLKIPKWGGSIEVNASDFGELFSNFSIYNDMPIIKT